MNVTSESVIAIREGLLRKRAALIAQADAHKGGIDVCDHLIPLLIQDEESAQADSEAKE